MSDTETTTEHPRVTMAREALAGNRLATDLDPLAVAERLGAANYALESLLTYVDERCPRGHERDTAAMARYRTSLETVRRPVRRP